MRSVDGRDWAVATVRQPGGSTLSGVLEGQNLIYENVAVEVAGVELVLLWVPGQCRWLVLQGVRRVGYLARDEETYERPWPSYRPQCDADAAPRPGCDDLLLVLEWMLQQDRSGTSSADSSG